MAASQPSPVPTLRRPAPSARLRPRLPPDCRACAQDLFRSLDKNADGEVTRDELEEALRSLGVQSSSAEIDELFVQLDPDRSGAIVFRELQLAILSATRETPLGAPPGVASARSTVERSTVASRAASRPPSRPPSRHPSRPRRTRPSPAAG